jgi:membrane protein
MTAAMCVGIWEGSMPWGKGTYATYPQGGKPPEVEDLVRRLRERHRIIDVLFSVQGRYGELQGNVIAGSLTLTLFVSLFPLLLLAVAVLGFVSASSDTFVIDVIKRFGLTGQTARLVSDGIGRAEHQKAATTVVGIIGLAWTSIGVVNAIQRAVDRAWQQKTGGVRDRLVAAEWLVAAGIGLGLSFSLIGYLSAQPDFISWLGGVLGLVVQTTLAWWTFVFLGHTDVGWRPRLPGALLLGLGSHLLTVAGAYYIPRAVAHSSALFGSIGVVFAVVAWLLVFGRLFVYAGVLNVVLYERSAGTVRVEIEAPNIPGEVALGADRAGVVSELKTPDGVDEAVA